MGGRVSCSGSGLSRVRGCGLHVAANSITITSTTKTSMKIVTSGFMIVQTAILSILLMPRKSMV